MSGMGSGLVAIARSIDCSSACARGGWKPLKSFASSIKSYWNMRRNPVM